MSRGRTSSGRWRSCSDHRSGLRPVTSMGSSLPRARRCGRLSLAVRSEPPSRPRTARSSRSGANEVPNAHGGSHWEEDGVGNRDFEIGDVDTNRKHFDELAHEIADRIDERTRTLVDGRGFGGVPAAQATLDELRAHVRDALPTDLWAGGLKDLTEFGRAVHAEMNALLDAGRRGVPVASATMHTTTFPCHNCARHIIGAGIGRVVFIEPYTKSRAEQLHADSATIARAERDPEKVAFEPFVGVAPRRYREMFDAAAPRAARARRTRRTRPATNAIRQDRRRCPCSLTPGSRSSVPRPGNIGSRSCSRLTTSQAHGGIRKSVRREGDTSIGT